MNNLNKSPDRDGTPVPDILRNLNVKEDVNEKGYHKENVGDAIEKKPLNCDTEDQSNLSEREASRRKSRKLKKGLGFLGWIFCCPVMAIGIAVRDKPNCSDSDELKDDPCLPCMYDVNYHYPRGNEVTSL